MSSMQIIGATAAAALALAIHASAPAGAWRHDVDRAAFAALGASPELQPVGFRFRVGDSARAVSSAVLIATEWALTAAHTVDRPERHRETRFVFGTDTVGIREVVLHPGFSSSRAATVDLAVVRLDRPVGSVRPATLSRHGRDSGARVIIAGFGYALAGNTLAGGMTEPGVRHAGANLIDSVTPTQLLLDFDSPTHPELNRTGAAAADSLEYVPLGGDSGGGAFVVGRDGWQLVGINANVEFDLGRVDEYGWYGSLVRLTRVQTAAAWIDSTMNRERSR